ncbi:MAG: LacI family transcriptional regulator, partial [Lachnospiraceae bacterium]|nr:LacI family transcriptional regulator [Lachnospiraceae bacterium]
MKRIAAVLMSVILCLSLSGCAENTDEEKGIEPAPDFVPLNEIVEGRKNIYLIVKILEGSSYWQVIIDGA